LLLDSKQTKALHLNVTLLVKTTQSRKDYRLKKKKNKKERKKKKSHFPG